MINVLNMCRLYEPRPEPIFRVSDQVRHKPGCTATKVGYMSESLNLNDRAKIQRTHLNLKTFIFFFFLLIFCLFFFLFSFLFVQDSNIPSFLF